MNALGVDIMYYLCWRPDVSSVFEVERNDQVFGAALEIVKEIYTQDNPKRPTKLGENVSSMKETIREECRQIRFVGEFPSAVSSTEKSRIQAPMSVCDATDLYERIRHLLTEAYELNREKATEAVVFLECDRDRTWSKNPFRWAPINWFPKGYSLNGETMRKILTSVQNKCYQRGVHVPAISFDGQWHNFAVRSQGNHPLTLLQLQKDVWKEAEKTQKSEIVRAISAGKSHLLVFWTIG
jgi:hypothetical protein